MARALASLVRHGYSDPRTVALYAPAVALASEAEDPKVLLPEVYGVWAGRHVAEAVGPALEVAAQMLDDAARRGNSDLEMMGNRLLPVSLTMGDRFTETRPCFMRAARLYDPSRHRTHTANIGIDPIVGTNCYWALAELALGHPSQHFAVNSVSPCQLAAGLRKPACLCWVG